MADYTKYPNATMALAPDELEMLREEAEREHRSISNFLYSIVMPEVKRRRAERQPQAA